MIDRGRVGTTGPDQLSGRFGVPKCLDGNGHKTVEAAKQEVQLRLVARPQLAVECGVHPVPHPAHLKKERHRLPRPLPPPHPPPPPPHLFQRCPPPPPPSPPPA